MARDIRRDRIAHRGSTVGAAAVGADELMWRWVRRDRTGVLRIATDTIATAGITRVDSMHPPKRNR